MISVAFVHAMIILMALFVMVAIVGIYELIMKGIKEEHEEG